MTQHAQATGSDGPRPAASSRLQPEVLQLDTSRAIDEPVDPGLHDERRAILVRTLRVAYPHGRFPDEPYERTADAIEEAVAQTPEQAHVLAEGLDDLREWGLADADDEAATELLRKVADTPFFAVVHSTAIVALYDNPQVWSLLGYEGPSFDQGGYLHRGFDDLDWLPDPRITEYDGPPRVEVARFEPDDDAVLDEGLDEGLEEALEPGLEQEQGGMR